MIVILRETGCGGRFGVVTRLGTWTNGVKPFEASGVEGPKRTAKSCGPDAPLLASNSQEANASRG
jgi:hypothetical protein